NFVDVDRLLPNAAVSAVGWSEALFDSNGRDLMTRSIPLGRLVGSSKYSVTIAFNRRVALSDSNNNTRYDLGEDFRAADVATFTLSLVRDSDSFAVATVSSQGAIDQLFAQVPSTDQ